MKQIESNVKPFSRGFNQAWIFQTKLLQYLPVMANAAAPGPRQYVFLPGGSLTVADATQTYRVRFTRNNGYTVQTPYGVPPSDPWYMRIGFNLRPVAQEWAVQPFVPKMPYLLATWVPGTILSKNLIEFERQPVWFDPTVGQYPDVLVYDKNYQIQYALDGLPPNLKRPPDKGWLFPWRTSQILDMDSLHCARPGKRRSDPRRHRLRLLQLPRQTFCS